MTLFKKTETNICMTNKAVFSQTTFFLLELPALGSAWAGPVLAKLAVRRLGIELQILNDFLFIPLHIKKSMSTLKI